MTGNRYEATFQNEFGFHIFKVPWHLALSWIINSIKLWVCLCVCVWMHSFRACVCGRMCVISKVELAKIYCHLRFVVSWVNQGLRLCTERIHKYDYISFTVPKVTLTLQFKLYSVFFFFLDRVRMLSMFDNLFNSLLKI